MNKIRHLGVSKVVRYFGNPTLHVMVWVVRVTKHARQMLSLPDTLGVTVIFIGNGHGDQSLNTGQCHLHFVLNQYLWK